MPRSILIGLVVALAACARTSDNPPVVTAPMAGPAASAPSADAAVAVAVLPATDAAAAPVSSSGSNGATGIGDDPGQAPAQFRACQADGDCISVHRVGCCFNGDLVAVASSQKDAYAQSFTCGTPRPMCPMFIRQDKRQPKCDGSARLCTMVAPQP